MGYRRLVNVQEGKKGVVRRGLRHLMCGGSSPRVHVGARPPWLVLRCAFPFRRTWLFCTRAEGLSSLNCRMDDEADKEEDEGIVSDVHVSPNAPITVHGEAEEGRKQRDERDTAFVTRFTFRLPVCGQENDDAETPEKEVGILELDEQGDIVVSRRKPRRRIERVAAVTIVHSLSVPLSYVGLQVIHSYVCLRTSRHSYSIPLGVAREFGVGGLCGCK